MIRIYTGLDCHLGDLIIFTGLFPFIKKQWPDSYICFAMLDKYKEFGEIALADELINDVYFIENDEKLGHGSVMGREKEKEFKKQFDIAHDTSIVQIPDFPNKVGYKGVWGSILKHYGATKIPAIDVDMNIAKTRLCIDDNNDILNKLGLQEDNYIVIQTAGNKQTAGPTTLSPDKWTSIIKNIKTNTNFKVVQIGFNKEKEDLGSDIFLDISYHIRDLIFVIKNCKLLFGMNSGPGWMAGNYNKKSIIIMSSTSVAGDFRLIDSHYAVPNNKNMIVIQASGHNADIIPESLVLDVFYKILNKHEINGPLLLKV